MGGVKEEEFFGRIKEAAMVFVLVKEVMFY